MVVPTKGLYEGSKCTVSVYVSTNLVQVGWDTSLQLSPPCCDYGAVEGGTGAREFLTWGGGIISLAYTSTHSNVIKEGAQQSYEYTLFKLASFPAGIRPGVYCIVDSTHACAYSRPSFFFTY